MYPYTLTEVVSALRGSKNINAALKNFLKLEIRNGDPAGRFVKDLRSVVGAKSTEPLQRLVEQGQQKFERHIFVIVRYAYHEPMAQIAEQVAHKYADDFNATYEREDGRIKVIDLPKFKSIFKEVEGLFEQAINERKLGPVGLMKNALVTFVFDADVITELMSSWA